MFVKLKLESSDNTAPPQFFPIDDGATIYDLKLQLEPSIGIPADLQQIYALDRPIGNHDKVSAVLDCQVDKSNGTAFSLYKMEDFVCFLQFYNQEEGERQNNFFSLPLENRNLPIEKVAHLEISDSEQSYSEDTSESTSDSSSNSGSSTSSSGSSKAKKYQKRVHKNNVKTMLSQAKRARLSVENMDLHSLVDDTLNATLVPQENTTNSSGYVTASELTPPASDIILKIQAKDVAEPEPEPVAPVEEITNAEVAKDTKGVKDTAEIVVCSAPKQLPRIDGELSYGGVMPEKRKFALIIKNEIESTTSGFGSLMNHFHGLFETFEDCEKLQFSENASVKVLGNNLMIISDDERTCEWITNGTRSMTPPRYKCCSFIEFFGLIKCTFVLPIVVKDKELSIIFKLLEQQNVGIVTDKWVVTERIMLDPKSDDYAEKAASIIVDNQEIVLYVDRESTHLISEWGFKLKYCFWRLNFTFP
ncbi:uncharacterized protein LOC117585222 [Drosophila guanche]|uniref:DUF4780 domain-containing protein n=1 Tax=Drosophila guanche TaxID=7266 RepID=A0A3B0KI98_DROGU|nr:uncharacterized protein LOC117585222 [Drosophila guanche]SPP83448.1 Hypothetical predicted protein [Drosophila guanche]